MNIDKLISEEIEKFKLFSKYSPEKTLEENINEQNTYNTAFANNPLNATLGYNPLNTPQNPKSATTKTNLTARQKHVNNIYCSVKDGIITAGGDWSGKKWGDYVKGVSPQVSTAEIETAKASCPQLVINTNEKKVPSKLNWIPEKFPLKYMMQGENVKKLQQALDIRNKAGQPNITGKFYNATQLALDKKAQELGLNYDRNLGLDQATFNDIVSPRQKIQPQTTIQQVQPKNIQQPTPPQINPVVPSN